MDDTRFISLAHFTNLDWIHSDIIIGYLDNIIQDTNKNVQINIPFMRCHPNAIKIFNYISQKYDSYYAEKKISFNYVFFNKLVFHEDLWMFFYFGKINNTLYAIFYYYTKIFGNQLSVLSYLPPSHHIMRYDYMKRCYPNVVHIKDFGKLCNEKYGCLVSQKFSRNRRLGTCHLHYDEIMEYIIKNIKNYMTRYPRGQCFVYPIIMSINTENDPNMSHEYKNLYGESECQYDFNFIKNKLVQIKFIKYPRSDYSDSDDSSSDNNSDDEGASNKGIDESIDPYIDYYKNEYSDNTEIYVADIISLTIDDVEKIQSEFFNYNITYCNSILFIEPKFVVVPNICSEYYWSSPITFFRCLGNC